MRTAYAHDAVLALEPGADTGAPGAAVTVALCGSWEHAGPCPLAAHHTAARRDGSQLRVHVLFAAPSDQEAAVCERIAGALASGRLTGPDGTTSSWRLVRQGAGAVRDDERGHALRLTEEG